MERAQFSGHKFLPALYFYLSLHILDKNAKDTVATKIEISDYNHPTLKPEQCTTILYFPQKQLPENITRARYDN